MTLNDFITRFQLHPPVGNQGYPHNAKQSAVLLPLCELEGELHILFCKRPSYLKHHPAEICFPGGKFELADGDLRTTALRESNEELNLAAQHINLIGELDAYWTLTGFEIKPYVGIITDLTAIQPAEDEVEKIFYIPFSALRTPQNWQPLPFVRQNKPRILQGFYTEHGLLWGATAQIVRNLVKQVSV
ncbi:NUDIX hydrolase [Pseudoalteromonas tunicata]|uniref:Nudix hydrolase domain-containing protein n=1 Tax=Pseudoalteromonas tunicata D2 TaxID=87626 RepID=A4CBL8_9GAMM|nr:CoA pyrophosphatase [Pseudoalteromonas tunicata]ATC94311.1 hypothetical protein PTUN_a1718 [Pseudoalteromonas tunicata]AXT30053.1 CoA pyrophosphatase [Pseudoalteromonas tunicata]EAR27755.1 hypothetical protein PTD2_18075 [Pseudoalteromonas tunicata D2]